jgi:hypothetical protein
MALRQFSKRFHRLLPTLKWCYYGVGGPTGLPIESFEEPTGSGAAMLKRFVLAFAVLALAVASAETYRVTLFEPSFVKGTELKAGSYRLDVQDQKVVIASGKQSIEVPVTVESVDRKFSSTTVRYVPRDGKNMIAEIRLGGTTTKLVFN